MDTVSNTATAKVSVVMSVYNRDFTLVKRAIDSVLHQDYGNFELLILDDGSNNQLGKQLLQYCSVNEDKITYIRHQNIGQGPSVNRGLQYCKGSFVGFIDSDDEYKPNHISECVSQMGNGYDLIASVTESIGSKEEDYWIPNKYNPNENIHVDDCIVFGTLFGKREIFDILKFNSSYSLDSDLFDRASELYKTKKLRLKTYIYHLGTKDGIITNVKKGRKRNSSPT